MLSVLQATCSTVLPLRGQFTAFKHRQFARGCMIKDVRISSSHSLQSNHMALVSMQECIAMIHEDNAVIGRLAEAPEVAADLSVCLYAVTA